MLHCTLWLVAKKVTPDQKRVFAARLRDGWSIAESARGAGVSYAWAKAYAKGLRDSSGESWITRGQEDKTAEGPVPLEQLEEAPKRALDDIGFFAERYFGAVVMPWQEEATELIVRLQATDDEEYVVINCPPGSGKSTFFTKIVPAWITCRQRHIRGLVGSASMQMAKQYVGELRSALESPVALSQSAEALRRLYAVEPKGCLVQDYGKFKDEDRKWASDAFFVMQHGGALYGAKEPTWQAFGRGSTFIGARVDFCVWDDVYDPEQMRTPDAKQQLRDWWERYAETRLEPGGLLVLQGQRMEADDIYRFALDRTVTEFDASGEPVGGSQPKYQHIKFPAHSEDRCIGAEGHRPSSDPYPKGCLLYPRRLGWQKLASIRENNPENFEVVYQQEESAPGGVLVEKIWVTGGIGPDGMDHPGCWDSNRGACELPNGLERPWVSIASVDPSPTNFWAIQWWVYHPQTELRYLMDTIKVKMTGSEFLDWDPVKGEATGLMVEWQERSMDLGIPISTWIVEVNVANRFLIGTSASRRFQTKYSAGIVPHDTNRNKHDPRFGITTLAPHWKYGRVRLPGRKGDPGFFAAGKLVSEVTRYRLDGRPSGSDDQVHAEWFFEFNLPNLYRERKAVRMNVPSWVGAGVPA